MKRIKRRHKGRYRTLAPLRRRSGERSREDYLSEGKWDGAAAARTRVQIQLNPRGSKLRQLWNSWR